MILYKTHYIFYLLINYSYSKQLNKVQKNVEVYSFRIVNIKNFKVSTTVPYHLRSRYIINFDADDVLVQLRLFRVFERFFPIFHCSRKNNTNYNLRQLHISNLP